MSDKPDSLDALAAARKRCPQCGHENHLMAKVCANCGYEFPVTVAAPLDSTEKICPKCGHANRPGAKICSQCGTALPIGTPPPAPTPTVGATTTRAKKCPECGTVCKLDAKVCPNCGHRFQTDFSQAGSAPPVTPPAITEPPVVQMPSVGMTLPTEYDDRTRYADLPPDPAPTPQTPVPAIPTAATPDTSANATPTVTPDAADNDDTSGEPAPDLTELDIDALRRRSPDNNDSSGRVNISFRKDRP